MKKSKVVLIAFIMGIMLSMTPTALAGEGDNITSGGQSDCPAGTYSVAKVQFNDSGDKIDYWDYGDEYVNVTVNGFNNGSWDSSPYRITAVAYKIDNLNVSNYTVDYRDEPPADINWSTGDTFNYSDAVDDPEFTGSGDPAISHIEFCATSTTPPVPELPTMALTSIGLLGVLFFYRRFK